MLIDLTKIKKHLNIDAAFTDDDSYIESLYLVAEELVQKHIDQKFEDIKAIEGKIPEPLIHAILLLIGDLYDNRESVAYTSISELPFSLRCILQMYRNYEGANI